MRLCALAAVVLASCSASLFADFSLGSKIDSVQVSENSTAVTIPTAGVPATAVIFISTKCPISNSYNDRMNAIFKEYLDRGVRFVFVNANSNEPLSEIQEHARANQFAFKVYKDVNNVLADQFGATVTPEVYVFDKSGVLQYHGQVDDATNEARVRVRGFRNALDAVLAGKPVEVKETKAFGCTIKKVRRAN
jgi:protein-disulfide isomerase